MCDKMVDREPEVPKEPKIEKEEKSKSKLNPWIIVTIALAVLLIISILTGGLKPLTGYFIKDNVREVRGQQAADVAIKFINENILEEGSEAKLNSDVIEINGLYNFNVTIDGRLFNLFVSKDGKLLFPSAIKIEEIKETTTQTQQTTEIPKTDKPIVQLFVMSFCPYGIQAENIMKPVVDLLGTKADIQVHFIATVSGTTPDTVQSLHGTPEAMEDLRQACIMKYYNQKTFWNYLMTINANCSSKYRNSAAYDTCWKDAATNAGIDVSKIDTCSKDEGVELIKADADLSSENSVSGSPTLIINGIKYNGSRSSEAYKQAICNAFTTEPPECSQTLPESSGSSNPSGGCVT